MNRKHFLKMCCSLLVLVVVVSVLVAVHVVGFVDIIVCRKIVEKGGGPKSPFNSTKELLVK